MIIFIYIMIGIMGVLFGSFFTLAVYRLPRKENIVYERSYCPKCKHKLNFFDLIPVLSYLFLKGKCRYCNEKISVRYILFEILSGISFILIAVFMNINVQSTYFEIANYIYTILIFSAFSLILGIGKFDNSIYYIMILGILVKSIYVLFILKMVVNIFIIKFIIYYLMTIYIWVLCNIKRKEENNQLFMYYLLILFLTIIFGIKVVLVILVSSFVINMVIVKIFKKDISYISLMCIICNICLIVLSLSKICELIGVS